MPKRRLLSKVNGGGMSIVPPLGAVTPNTAAAVPAAAGGVPAETYCPYRQSVLLQQALTPDKMRVGFFLGAGCPVSIRIDENGAAKPLIPDIAGLTARVRADVEASDGHKEVFAAVMKRLTETGKVNPNVEDILSIVRALREVVGSSDHDGISAATLGALDEKVCAVTKLVVDVRLPSNSTPYHQLATWMGAIPRTSGVEVFTPNYDLLMEEALEERRIPYFDGFVGSCRPFFDLAAIEQDNLPARWARLWKVHGSINWRLTSDGNIERGQASLKGDQLLIYPSHLKYDQSRRMPYLAMLDRVKAFLARGQAVLVTCGYSFMDQHLNETILQSLSANPNAICFGMLFGERGANQQAVAHARKHANLNLLAVDGAVIGTVERDWTTVERSDHPLHAVAVATGEMKHRTSAPPERCKFLLGDFMAFGRFLAEHLAARADRDGAADAP